MFFNFARGQIFAMPTVVSIDLFLHQHKGVNKVLELEDDAEEDSFL